MTFFVVADKNTKSDDGKAPPMETEPTDDSSITTAMAGSGSFKNDVVKDEITILVDIKHVSTSQDMNVYKRHALLLDYLLRAGNKSHNTLVVIDNKGNEYDNIDPNKMGVRKTHMKFFNSEHQQQGEKSHTIIAHRIRTNVRISSLKKDKMVSDCLKEWDIYIRKHNFTEDILATSNLGFIRRIHPKSIPPETAKARIIHEIEAATKEKAPKFNVYYSRPSIKVGSKTLSTQAYSITVPKAQKQKMHDLLSQTYKGSGLYVPIAMKYKPKYHDAFKIAILDQEKYKKSTWTIPLLNTSSEQLAHLAPELVKINGVKELHSVYHRYQQNRSVILVDYKRSSEARAQIQQVLPELVKALPSNLVDDPKVLPRLPATEDDLSEGSNSYMSLSAASIMSLDLSDGFLSEFDSDLIGKTILGKSSPNASELTEPPSQILTTNQESQAIESQYKQQLEAKNKELEGYKIKITQLESTVQQQTKTIDDMKASQQESFNAMMAQFEQRLDLALSQVSSSNEELTESTRKKPNKNLSTPQSIRDKKEEDFPRGR